MHRAGQALYTRNPQGEQIYPKFPFFKQVQKTGELIQKICSVLNQTCGWTDLAAPYACLFICVYRSPNCWMDRANLINLESVGC